VRVTNQNINHVYDILKPLLTLAADTETTGLNLFKDDEIFAFVLAHKSLAFYFDWEFVDKEEAIALLSDLARNPLRTWYLHNAKFDLNALSTEGVEIAGAIHDTEVVARLLKNDELSYTLDLCAKRANLKNQKLSDVKDYCLEHKLWEWDVRPGKKVRKKNFFFAKVPKDIMEKYTIGDGLTTFELAEWQIQRMEEMEKNKKQRVASMKPLYKLEQDITKVLQTMEVTGVQLDVPYTRKSLDLETKKFHAAADTFEKLTGTPFKDSDKLFVDVFKAHGLTYGLTEKGNASFKKEYLQPQRSHPVVGAILDYRDSFKIAGAYYQTFLHLADGDGVLHANFRQSGAATGRFSVTDPALQTLKKDEDEVGDEDALDDETKSQVRRCIIPRPGYYFVMIDYKQMEYRVMLDYAGETKLIELVAAGADVHQATADLVGSTRKQAKTINFGLLYGTGVAKLSQMLKCTEAEATKMKSNYFAKLPAVERFTKNVIATAKYEGRIYNKFGRVYSFLDRNFAYKAPNYLIQGGCSDVMRTAMLGCFNRLRGMKSRMILQVHDELIFEIHESELHVVPDLKQIMIEAWPHRLLAMDGDIEWSDISWQDKKEWK
jgi:DNA polymerase-1